MNRHTKRQSRLRRNPGPFLSERGEDMGDVAITINSILGIFGAIVAIVAGITAISKIVKFFNDYHDKVQKWDAYEKQIEEANNKIKTAHNEATKALTEIQKETQDSIEQLRTDTDAKLQELKAEQCMLTYCMLATLDGLKQLGCNGKVTEARNSLEKHINKQAHGQNA